MKIVMFTHPAFVAAQSMPRFARMLQEGFEARGHTVQLWTPQPRAFHWVPPGGLRKWAGYVDQYVLFPRWVRQQLRRQTADTLYVFCDQALGPWVPLVRHLPHVVHVHDLLALRSALGGIPERHTKLTGRIYQHYIRRGFEAGRNFISISHKTRDDLHQYSDVKPLRTEVVYNGLNYPFSPLPPERARQLLAQAGLQAPADGMLLHVSGGSWYKNVPGVLRIYAAYARTQAAPLPLWLVGKLHGPAFEAALAEVPAHASVVRLHDLDAAVLHATYSLAQALLFPSHEEGFGWPIIEAQACGCPVITTDLAPMNEVGGPDCIYLPRLHLQDNVLAWASYGGARLTQLLGLNAAAQAALRERCAAWSARFQAEAAIERYLRIYEDVTRAHACRHTTYEEPAACAE